MRMHVYEMHACMQVFECTLMHYIVLNSEVTELKACLQKQELQLHSKAQELKEAQSKVSTYSMYMCIIGSLVLIAYHKYPYFLD